MHSRTTKSLLITALSLFLIFSAHKESSAQKFIIGYGLSFYTDVAITAPVQSSLPDGSTADTQFDFSIISLSLEMKYNVYEFNTDLALSVATSPSFGISTFEGGMSEASGFGNVRIPVYLQLDYGNLSTFESMKNFGVGIGIGYQFDNYGLFGENETLSFGTVAARVGFRYFNRNNKSREIAIKAGLPKTYTRTHEYFDSSDEAVESNLEQKITSFQLSWILYFNY